MSFCPINFLFSLGTVRPSFNADPDHSLPARAGKGSKLHDQRHPNDKRNEQSHSTATSTTHIPGTMAFAWKAAGITYVFAPGRQRSRRKKERQEAD